MQYWLMKSEPGEYSWAMLEKDGTTAWDGVRNYQAQNFMKQMKVGDKAFFYHSVSEKRICGIVEICKEFYKTTDPKFGMVDVQFYKPLENRVTLADLKENAELKGMIMLKQSRLSVSPVTEEEWDAIMKMSQSADT